MSPIVMASVPLSTPAISSNGLMHHHINALRPILGDAGTR